MFQGKRSSLAGSKGMLQRRGYILTPVTLIGDSGSCQRSAERTKDNRLLL